MEPFVAADAHRPAATLASPVPVLPCLLFRCDPNQAHNTNLSTAQYLAYVNTAGAQNCQDYAGQKGGLWQSCGSAGCANDAAPAFGRAARTDVEGCCWWGRGVIQTTGVCNFGKLNYYLGARAASEGRPALFPDLNFCADPGAICSSTKYPQLKWIAGLYYYMTQVQPWNDGSWNYIAQLRAFVDAGLPSSSTSFINGVSGIVNRGCPSLTACPTGPVDSAPQRAANFQTVLKAMNLV